MSTRLVLMVSMLVSVSFAEGCFVEVSSSGSRNRSADEFGSRLEAEFARKTGGVNSTIRCPTSLAGRVGNRFMCSGETSDGFTLEIAVLERGGDDFRWDVVESEPIR
jgi:hypothetical protein